MSALNTERARELLCTADFRTLFIELLGWDRHNQHVDITVDGRQFKLNAVAHKRGMVAFECLSMDDKSILSQQDCLAGAQMSVRVYLDSFNIIPPRNVSWQVAYQR